MLGSKEDPSKQAKCSRIRILWWCVGRYRVRNKYIREIREAVAVAQLRMMWWKIDWDSMGTYGEDWKGLQASNEGKN